MTNEAIILRAYALLSQGQYEAVEKMLKSAPEVLNTPSGADLFARLRFEQGAVDEARQIWEHIHKMSPDFEPAVRALDAFKKSSKVGSWAFGCLSGAKACRHILIIGVVLIGLLISSYMLLRHSNANLPKDSADGQVFTNVIERVETKIEKQYITNFVDRVRVEFVDRVVTNIVEKVVEVPSQVVLTNTIENVVWVTNQVGAIERAETVVAQEKRLPLEESVSSFVLSTPYVVKDGDTVSTLSVKYKFRIPDFVACNPRVDINLIRVGQTILFPGNVKIEDENGD